MRKIEQEMISAVIGHYSMWKSNTSVSVNADGSVSVFLFGNKIADISMDEQTWCLTNCGYETPTTTSRLNALLDRLCCGKLIDSQSRLYWNGNSYNVPVVNGKITITDKFVKSLA